MAEQDGELSAKAVRKAVKHRAGWLLENKDTVTLKSLRRLLEEDLRLVAHSLDAEPHKSAIKALVDELMVLMLAPPDEAPAAKKAKRDATAAAAPPSANGAKLGGSSSAVQLKALLKAAAIPVPPALYKAAAGDEAALCDSLEALLAREGLSAGSDARAVGAVRRRRELAKDLDGIETKNIVDDGRRPSRAAAARPVAVATVAKPLAPVLPAAAPADWDDDDE